MTDFTENAAATHGQEMAGNDQSGTEAPNAGRTARRGQFRAISCSGLSQKGDANLVGIAPNQLGLQLHTRLPHQKVKPAWKDWRASNYEPCSVSRHVAYQTIYDAIAVVEGDLAAQIGPSSVQFSTFDRHGRSRGGTDRAVYLSLSNRGAALAPADALDIAGASDAP